jgi:hypothetical protein
MHNMIAGVYEMWSDAIAFSAVEDCCGQSRIGRANRSSIVVVRVSMRNYVGIRHSRQGGFVYAHLVKSR